MKTVAKLLLVAVLAGFGAGLVWFINEERQSQFLGVHLTIAGHFSSVPIQVRSIMARRTATNEGEDNRSFSAESWSEFFDKQNQLGNGFIKAYSLRDEDEVTIYSGTSDFEKLFFVAVPNRPADSQDYIWIMVTSARGGLAAKRTALAYSPSVADTVFVAFLGPNLDEGEVIEQVYSAHRWGERFSPDSQRWSYFYEVTNDLRPRTELRRRQD